jgi:uncharacterized phage protein (TIGR01671 family)
MSNKDLQSGRVIKFRGMTIGGNWVFGLLAENTQYKIAFEPGWYISNAAGVSFAYQVRPETIGQFTGLKDKAGKEIHEGDIVRAARMYHGKPGIPFTAFIFYNNHIGAFRIGYDSLSGGAQDEIYFAHETEVIGNIHEHKNLLEK